MKKKHYTELIPGKLWAGDAEGVHEAHAEEQALFGPEGRLTRVVTFVDIDLQGVDVRRVIASDDAKIEPEDIAALLHVKRPATCSPRFYCACQLGQNRSSAMAACFLLQENMSHKTADEVIAFVEEYRTPDLASIGRSGAKVSPQMRENVRAFARWIKPREDKKA